MKFGQTAETNNDMCRTGTVINDVMGASIDRWKDDEVFDGIRFKLRTRIMMCVEPALPSMTSSTFNDGPRLDEDRWFAHKVLWKPWFMDG